MQRNLHVHGESANDTIGQFGGGRTSPDAWRKLNSHTNGILTSGNISACVEKAVRPYSDEPNNRDISTCMEKIRSHPVCESIPGRTSPHTRRKRLAGSLPPLHHEDISTCMEKTEQTLPGGYSVSGHLRVCGENVSLPRTARFLEGTSPHTRRKLFAPTQPGRSFGTSPRTWRKLCLECHPIARRRDISAYAEKTSHSRGQHASWKGHLHVCGEN